MRRGGRALSEGTGIFMRVIPKLFAGLILSLSLALPAFALETFTDEAKARSIVRRTPSSG